MRTVHFNTIEDFVAEIRLEHHRIHDRCVRHEERQDPDPDRPEEIRHIYTTSSFFIGETVYALRWDHGPAFKTPRGWEEGNAAASTAGFLDSLSAVTSKHTLNLRRGVCRGG